MTADEVIQYIQKQFAGIVTVNAEGTSFFFFDPDQKLAEDKRWPIFTLVTSDAWDKASNLNRPGVYRLNIGISGETYRKLFGEPPAFPRDNTYVQTGHDFTALNQIMPHPIYAKMNFVCVLNPEGEVWEQTKKLLAEAHAMAEEKYDLK